MMAAALWAWSDIRRRHWSLLALAALVALPVGFSLALVAGAQRAGASVDRFVESTGLADVVVFTGGEPGTRRPRADRRGSAHHRVRPHGHRGDRPVADGAGRVRIRAGRHGRRSGGRPAVADAAGGALPERRCRNRDHGQRAGGAEVRVRGWDAGAAVGARVVRLVGGTSTRRGDDRRDRAHPVRSRRRPVDGVVRHRRTRLHRGRLGRARPPRNDPVAPPARPRRRRCRRVRPVDDRRRRRTTARRHAEHRGTCGRPAAARAAPGRRRGGCRGDACDRPGGGPPSRRTFRGQRRARVDRADPRRAVDGRHPERLRRPSPPEP